MARKKRAKTILPTPLVQTKIKHRVKSKELKKAYQKTGLTPAVHLYYHKVKGTEYADPFVALLAVNCQKANELRNNNTILDLSIMSDIFADESFGPVYSQGFASGWGARSADDIEDMVYMVGYNDGHRARVDLLGDNCMLVEDM